MFAPHAARAPWRSALFVRAFAMLVPLVVTAAAVAVGGTDMPTAVGAAAICGLIYGVRLIRLAYDRYPNQRAVVVRSAGLLGVGMIIAALTAATAGVLVALDVNARTVAQFIAGGSAATATAFLPALLLLPGASRRPVARLRRALDGLSVGICLLFTGWVLIIAPHGNIDSLAFWISMLTCFELALAVVTALRAGTARRAASLCAAGVAATVIGLDGLAICVNDHYIRVWPSLFALLLLAAPVVAWSGARRSAGADDRGVVDESSTLASYPVLAVPVTMAIAVALYRVVVNGQFDQPSVFLGILGVAVVSLRETLASFDVARFAHTVSRQEAHFRNLVAGSTDVIMVLDGDLIVRWQSPASARQFGLSDQDVVGRHFQSMVHPDDAVLLADRLADVRAGYGTGADGDRPALVEARLRDGFGQWRETESTISDQRDVAEVAGLVVHIRDVTERKEMERTLHRLAYADQLTGLANRRQMLMSIVAARSVQRVRGALLLLELDGFSAVNDVRGYDIGDAVLIEVARRLRAGASPTDMPARLSGDEFAIVTEASPVQAYALASRLLTMLAEPIVLPGVTVHLGASIGLTELACGENCEEVLRRANLALRRAKQLGRGRVEWYDEAVEQVLVRRVTLEQELPEALRRGEMDLIYQPILDIVATRPFAVEALLRWRHPRLGTLLPADIIPVAEDLGLINEIGTWVLKQAARQLAGWLREGRDLSVAVNVSTQQLLKDLPADVAATLEENDLPPERFVIELAEPGLCNETPAICDRLSELRALGVRTALDEFGTGPDSLSNLRRLPMDIVKIGRPFFDCTAEPATASPIIDVMVGLGRRLGIDVVAHGLEAPEHLDVVRAAGCRLGQGHLFSRPQPAERIEAYLDGFGVR
jgi:diguanylate cyclase (GGDEF)-like protein/PAS domain S-box-containing protein